MAPSWSDYRGAGRAAIMVGLATIAVLLVLSAVITNPEEWFVNIADFFSPLLAVMAITVVLCTLATVIVSLLVSIFPKRYRVG